MIELIVAAVFLVLLALLYLAMWKLRPRNDTFWDALAEMVQWKGQG